MPEILTSVQNPRIKNLVALQQKSSLRRKTGLFVVEGARETRHCIDAGYRIDSIFLCPSLLEDFSVPAGVKHFEVSPEVYEKVAYRGSTEGIIAVVESRKTNLEDIALSANPLIVVLESVEKPGNLGAVLRSADAAGADAVIICDPLTDLYNPNLVRASIGSIFTKQVVCCSSEQAISWLKKNNIKIYTAQLQDSNWYYDTDMKSATAIVMGTEATGLTGIWRQAADAHIKIPMLGALDSLNVSVSAAILLFEAVRQRNG